MAPICFGLRPSSGSLQLSLAKVILILKHSVRLRRNLLCGGVAACPGMACVLYAVQSTAHSRGRTCGFLALNSGIKTVLIHEKDIFSYHFQCFENKKFRESTKIKAKFHKISLVIFSK